MHIPLSLKYRPQQLADLCGQEFVQRTLVNTIKSKKIAPAYLFAGHRGTGKTSAARILAKSLNCTHSALPTLTPCGECQSCRSIEKATSLDVTEIDAASHNGVEDARQLVERSNLAPAIGRYRIWILDECHMLTSQAMNALLKCLEEPPAKVIFILCTTEPQKLLPTITSRCQVLNFRSLSLDSITEQLSLIAEKEEIAISTEAVRAIARTASGGLRDALQVLSQLSLLEGEIEVQHVLEVSGEVIEDDLVAIIQAVIANDTFTLLLKARELIDSGKPAITITRSLLKVYHDLLIINSSPKSKNLIAGAIAPSRLIQLASALEHKQIMAGLEELQKAEHQLKQSLQPNLWLEVFLVGLIAEKHNANTNGRKNGATVVAPHPEAIWNQVLATTTPKNRQTLSVAMLTEIEGSEAVLAVPPNQVAKFNKLAEKIAKMVSKVCDKEIQISIEELD